MFNEEEDPKEERGRVESSGSLHTLKCFNGGVNYWMKKDLLYCLSFSFHLVLKKLCELVNKGQNMSPVKKKNSSSV